MSENQKNNPGDCMGFISKQNPQPKKAEHPNYTIYKQVREKQLKQMAQEVFGLPKNEKDGK